MQNQTKKIADLLRYLTRELIVDQDALDSLIVNKMDPARWPESRAKDIAMSYIEHRAKENHAYAAIQVSGYFDELDGPDDFPKDPNILRAYFGVVVTEYKAYELAHKILKSPGDVEALIANFSADKGDNEIVRFVEVYEETVRETIELAKQNSAVKTIPKWPDLSAAIDGIGAGRVSIAMAETGFGKTTLAQNLAMSCANKYGVLYFNMEMIQKDFTDKLIMIGADLDYKSYKLEASGEENMKKIAGFFADSIQYNNQLYFSKGRTLSPQEICAVARNHKKKHGLDIVIVDYDQKLVLNTSKELPEWKALQTAVESFEGIAKELGIYVMILAQENEDGNISGSKRSKYPASTVLRFYKNDEGKYIVEAVKNRFGPRGAKIEVNYVQEKGSITEIGKFISTGERTSKIFGPKKPQVVIQGNIKNHAEGIGPSRYSSTKLSRRDGADS